MLFGRKKKDSLEVDTLFRHFSTLVALLMAKGYITKEELDIASQPILLLQSNNFEEYAKAIKVALTTLQQKSKQEETYLKPTVFTYDGTAEDS